MAIAAKRLRSLVKSPKPRNRKAIPANSIRALRRRKAMSQSLFARLLGVSLRTVGDLEVGKIPQTQARRNLTQITRLGGALAEVTMPTQIGRWLDEPNEMLGGLKPVEAIERGQIDLVWQVVEGLRSGSPL